jgi:hypothetical protein
VVQLNLNDPVHGLLLNPLQNDPSRMLLLAFGIAMLLGGGTIARRIFPRLGASWVIEPRMIYGLLVGLAAGAFIIWANTPTSWEHEIDYREYVVLLTVPLLVLAAADASIPSRAYEVLRERGWTWWWASTSVDSRTAEQVWRERAGMIVALAAVFALVLAVQSARWHGLTDRLTAQLAFSSRPCVDPSSVGERHTVTDGREPVSDWWVPALAIVLQGREPERVLLNPGDCADLAKQGRVKVAFFEERSWADGWFKFPR